MAKVKTVTHYKATEIKKEITNKGVRKDTLRLFIIGYVTDGNREPFEADEVYYSLSIATYDHSFDIEVMDSTSLAKVKQRQLALYGALHGYRGNRTVLVEYDEQKESYYGDY